MLCHIFKTGEHKDSRGNIKNWTTEDLDKIIYQFNNVHNTVPICIGHPISNTPAYGWIDEIKRIGDNLYCSFKDVQNEFKEAIQKGLFKNRSISLDKDLNIRHIAFLGAQAPAIKGLEQFCFSNSDEKYIYELQNFEDLKEKEEYMTENLLEQLKAKDDEILELKQKLIAENQAKKIKEFEDFADAAIKNGNILPKHKEYVVNILSVCDCAKDFSFSDDEPKSAIDSVKEFINSLKIMDYQDIAVLNKTSEKETISNANDFAMQLEKIMQEKNVDLTTAFNVLKN